MSIKKVFAGLAGGLLLASIAFGADIYKIDPVHTNIGFSVRHMGITNVKGKFGDVSGTIVYDDKNIAKSSVNVTIKAASINTDNDMRDKDLRSANFFEVDKYPEITFVSKSVKKSGDEYILTGTFTMHGVSKEISFPFTIIGITKDPWGSTRMGTEASLKVNRKDYGINYNKVLDNGGLVVANEVKIELEVEAVKQK